MDSFPFDSSELPTVEAVNQTIDLSAQSTSTLPSLAQPTLAVTSSFKHIVQGCAELRGFLGSHFPKSFLHHDCCTDISDPPVTPDNSSPSIHIVCDEKTPSSIQKLIVKNIPLNTALPDLNTISKLKVINLQNLGLNGLIPSTFLYNNLDLQKIILNDNKLNGPIPSELGRLNSLTLLKLCNNQLSGKKIPIYFSCTKYCFNRWLQDNQLSGTIPESFSTLPSLVSVFLSNNKFSGAVPDFSKLQSLSKSCQVTAQEDGYCCKLENLGSTCMNLGTKKSDYCLYSELNSNVCTTSGPMIYLKKKDSVKNKRRSTNTLTRRIQDVRESFFQPTTDNAFSLNSGWIAIDDYTPVLEDELEVKVGDPVFISSFYTDGWATGKNLRTGLSGQIAMTLLEAASDS
ncbi:hypothetical protein HDU92_004926 [Lobulomyces angularis]|nr:hypothetical protein HDU92_004926 [Lobulomyces angularis]